VAVQVLGGNSVGSVCSTGCIHPVLLVGRHTCSLWTACDVLIEVASTILTQCHWVTCRRIVMPSHSKARSKDSILLRLFTAEGEGNTILRNLVIAHPVAQCHVAEDLNLPPRRFEKPSSHTC
jgi:hypothetical protein